MALSATCIAEVQTGGSDSLNGGLFDPGQIAGMYSSGSITLGTTASPVFHDANYAFVSADIGAWWYGSNVVTPGWYQIASLSGTDAVLSATAGAGVLSTYTPTTVQGVGGATLSGITWSIDYSQQSSAQFAYTDFTTAGAGLVLSSAAHPFGKQQVGNSIVLTGGTNCTAGRYVLTSVSGANGTFLGAANATTGATSNGTGGMGGALASPGQAGAVMVAGNDLFLKTGTYTVTSASSNVAGGCLTLPAFASAANVTMLIGYGTVRGDYGTPPTIKAGSITTFTLVTCGTTDYITNIIFDGNNNQAGGTGLNLTASSFTAAYRCQANRFATAGFTNNGICILCSATGCSGTAFNAIGDCAFCTATANTASPFLNCGMCLGCLASSNTGGSTHGFSTTTLAFFVNCTSYANGGAGFIGGSTARSQSFINCYAESNTTYGFTCSSATNNARLYNCGGYNNTSGQVNLTTAFSVAQNVGFQTLTSTAFTNAAGNDFSLNNVAAGGALLRAAGIPGSGTLPLPGLSTLAYPDIGAAQHLATGVLLGQGMGGGMRG